MLKLITVCFAGELGKQSVSPRKVFLFSGHMIDSVDRVPPRFPPGKVGSAARKISEAMKELDAGANDIALTQGACGGDLLFTEACQERGVKVYWLQPFREDEFLKRSVVVGGETWFQRYVIARKSLAGPIRSAPNELGDPPPDADSGYSYERCNLWLLDTAYSYGVDEVHFVCLWDGTRGDNPGGTAHMYDEVNRRSGGVTWIDTRKL